MRLLLGLSAGYECGTPLQKQERRWVVEGFAGSAKKNKKEEEPVGASPVAAPMPKSVPP